MRVGLLSDSHGNVGLLARCAMHLVSRCGAERLFFLGGAYTDMDRALELFESESVVPPPVTRVPARGDPEYARGSKEIEMVGHLLGCLVHDKAELSKEDIANATVIFHGNSVSAALVRIGPRFFITPGHLRAQHPADQPPQFGLLALGPNALQYVVYGGDLEEKRRETAQFGRRTIFRVS